MSDKVKNRLLIAGAALCAALFLFSGAMLCREYLDQKQSAEAFDEVAGLVKEDVELPTLELADDPAQEPEELTAFEKYADVYAQNSDLLGWISIPGTRIDYPVMQTKDNPNFYLKHAFDKSYSSYGVPYMQENCDVGISDNLVLYGHHMNNGSMFSDLCKYPLRRWPTRRKGSSITTSSGPSRKKILTNLLPSARNWRSMTRA